MQGKRFLHSIRLRNLLSYGNAGAELALEPLNVLIGPNASGKSNLIEAISLLAAAPRDLLKPIREGGGAVEWIWKGSGATPTTEADVTALVEHPNISEEPLLYQIGFTIVASRFNLARELLAHKDVPIYRFLEGEGEQLSPAGLRSLTELYRLRPEERSGDRGLSIFSRLKDRIGYPELTFVGLMFDEIKFFREWNFSRFGEIRRPQSADLPDDFLLEDASNLALIINDLQNRVETKKLLLEKLKLFSGRVEDLTIKVQGGRIQIFLHETGLRSPIPMERLSDGTLHYLCLLAILCHPEPPPLICLEEPELGLHPDVIPKVAELLIDAARRTQLIVTTHSDALVSALSEIPESVVVCERGEEGTTLCRLQREALAEWLERYQLGELWSMGEIGGNRW